MHEAATYVLHAAVIGAGATAVMDVWGLLRKKLFGVPIANYGLVGRWLAYLPRGRLFHDAIAATPPACGEEAMGWIAHYLIGTAFAALLLALAGLDWVSQPSLAPALLVGVGTVAAPYFVLQPVMGLGIAARRAPNPAMARLHSLLTHAVFGLGLYLTALAGVFITTWL
jgi:hypothetical protein